MKTKIMNALKTAYANLGLSDKAFDGVASFLEKTISEEKDIATAIAGEDVKALLKSFQSESDTLRTAKAAAEKALKEYKESHPEQTLNPEPPKTPKSEEESEVLKLLKQMQSDNASLKARLDAADKKTRTETMSAAVKAALLNGGRDHQGILKYTLNDFTVEDDDTEESLIEKYEQSYDTMRKEMFGSGVVPTASGIFPSVVDDENEFAGTVDRLRTGGVLKKETK